MLQVIQLQMFVAVRHAICGSVWGVEWGGGGPGWVLLSLLRPNLLEYGPNALQMI